MFLTKNLTKITQKWRLLTLFNHTKQNKTYHKSKEGYLLRFNIPDLKLKEKCKV